MKHVSSDWTLVTGATGGIGAEFARQFAREGRKVVLVGRRQDRLETLAAELDPAGAGRAAWIKADLSAPNAAKELHAECARRGLAIDTLVNNAGSGLFGPATSLDAAGVESMLALNVTALTTLCGLFGADMAQKGRGAILNVGSVAGNAPMPYFAAYGATKAYVHAFSLALRAELAPAGVTVTCLLPGYVSTAFDDNAGIGSAAYRSFSSRNSMEAAKVAEIGIRALARGRALTVAGGSNRIATMGMRAMPRTLFPRVVKGFLDSLIAKG